MVGGFGQVAFGRCEFGQSKSDIEPRFYTSDPLDGAVGVSIYQYTIKFFVYGFSSRVQLETFLYVEVSEDGGGSYSDAYLNGAFVAPYNGANCMVDAHQQDSQALLMRIHKTSPWTNDKEVRVRVTARDEYEQEATKVTLVTW